MTLPASGAIALSQVNTELSLASTLNISLNQTNVRTLFGKASGIISLNDGHGKANSGQGTWDPANKSAGLTLSNGNKTAYAATAGMVRSLLHKAVDEPGGNGWAAEITIDAYGTGIWFGYGTSAQTISDGNYPGDSVNSSCVRSNGYAYFNGVSYLDPISGGNGTPWSSYGTTTSLIYMWPASGGVGHRVNVSGQGAGGMGINCPNVDPGDWYFFLKLTGGAQVTTNFGATAFTLSPASVGM